MFDLKEVATHIKRTDKPAGNPRPTRLSIFTFLDFRLGRMEFDYTPEYIHQGDFESLR
ncbi:hypothetical protein [Fulvimarina sp. MAC8]|uniref:hypothetical protein n=1 Tax=Fulvimarina sp. MAC8 TaxID=3162874 RepID=UPI0032F04F9A